MEEEWDESIMGPVDGALGVLRAGDTSTNPGMLRSQSSRSLSSGSRSSGSRSAPPPSSMFMTAIQSETGAGSADIAPERRSRAAMVFEDEEDDDNGDSSPPPSPQPREDSKRIRQEALRMLEVADDQLAESSYSVYRTTTGGYSATPKENGKRTPSALSGVSFAASRKNLARPFRDEPWVQAEASSASRSQAEAASASQRDFEYGEDKEVLDVRGMENRSADTRQAEEKSNWSSRYTIDHTLLALSGGSVSSSKMLDMMDKEHSNSRLAARNMFGSSPAETRSPQVFGSGFSFRQKHVFGNQGVVAKPESNLNKLYVDSSPEEVASPARSWNEDFQLKRRNRRNTMIGLGLLIVALVVIVSIVASGGKSSSKDSASISDAPDGVDKSVTFYVTADVPLSPDNDETFASDLQAMSPVADFVVHLGDIQRAKTTECAKERYGEVAALLKNSPIPAMIIPGQEDWVDCPNQQDGWDNWVNNFWEFERFFSHPFNVLRFEDQMENFAFVDKNVLFIGIHETNGNIVDMDELNKRNILNVEWIQASYNFHRTNSRAMVIFANGRPGLRENDQFYLGLAEFLHDNKIPTAYIHSNHQNGEMLVYKPFEFDGMEHVIAIQTARGEKTAPLRINVGFDNTNPFIVG